MKKSIIVMGTLDTRSEEIKYIRDRIQERGHKGEVVDVGVLGPVPFEPSITRHQVAEAAGTSIKDIIALGHEGRAISAMAAGASRIIYDLYKKGGVDGVIAAGGSMTTSLAMEVMWALPFGLPKLIVSTIAFTSLVTMEAASLDLSMMLWPGGLYGLNGISRTILDSAAGSICGSAEAFGKKEMERRRTVGMTALGTTQLRFMEILKPALEKRGYDVAVFHTVGGGTAYEHAIRKGLIDVGLDLSLVELTDYLRGGATTSGAHRLEAAAEKGIPQIIGAGAIGHFFWFSGRPLPPELQERKHHRHNQLLTIVVADTEDKKALGKLVAERLNRAKGPVSVVIPMIGWIEGDRHPKSPFHDEKGGRAFADALKSEIRENIRVLELDAHVNDPLFSEMILKVFDEMTISL